jgi:hypothetical protein
MGKKAGWHDRCRWQNSNVLCAIAAIDGIGSTERPQRTGTAKVGWLATESAPDLGRKPTQRQGYVGGDHRAPTDRAIGLRYFLDRAEYG